MCSGKTHDKITYVTAPLIAGLTYAVTNNIENSMIVTANFLFAGLMFGPDLDCKSIQTRRWANIGLGWYWTLYQQLIPYHRHPLSHGFIAGTVVRLLYFSPVLYLLAIAFNLTLSWQIFPLVFWGLEAGAMSHAIADQLCTNYKKIKKEVKNEHRTGNRNAKCDRKRNPKTLH